MLKHFIISALTFLMLVTLDGCTVHPEGERAEREAARAAGQPFQAPVGKRIIPALPNHPAPEDLVRYALLSNAGLEQKYWDWQSAIEQIPQDGTQPTNLALSAGTTISRGDFSRDMTTLTAQNDPMADIVWPEKLSVAARRALAMAHAAGLRFQKAKWDLRTKVLNAYYDYAVAADLIRLEQSNAQLLQTTMTVVDARYRAGSAAQQDLLQARNDLDLSRNEIAELQSQLPALRAALNALLNRDVDAALPAPDEIPPARPIQYSDEQLLSLAATQNPELQALASEIAAKHESIRLARLQYFPDFSLSAGTDLAGLSQSLAGMVTVPLLRYEAINAAIAQSEANLKSTEAMRRQLNNDLCVQVVLDISTLRDADRQLDLLEHTVLPRARQAVAIIRVSYEANKTSLLDLLDSQRSLIALQRLVDKLHAARAERLHSLEEEVVHLL